MAEVADFRALLPTFSAVADATIQAWLDTAALTVTSAWGADENTAQIYLAAHLMSMAGIGPESGAKALAAVDNLRSGSLSFTKDKRHGDYGLTSFGRLYAPILRSVRGGVRVTGTGDYPWPYGGPAPDDVNA